MLLALAGCASVPLANSTTGGPDEMVYDPAADWSNARIEERAPASIKRRFVRRPSLPEPGTKLRSFTVPERARIDWLQPTVRAASRDHGVPSDLINGIIWVESKFIPSARGRRGPRGLMQLMPRTGRALARELGLRYRPHDPEFNVHVGTFYFARMVRRFDGNLTLALAAYNIGPGTVRTWLEDHDPLPERSERYVKNVFTAARAFRAMGY